MAKISSWKKVKYANGEYLQKCWKIWNHRQSCKYLVPTSKYGKVKNGKNVNIAKWQNTPK